MDNTQGQGLFYFIFSSGVWDGYKVNGICVCDHHVSEDEWKAHCRAYIERLNQLHGKLRNKYPTVSTWRSPEEYRELTDWCAVNEPKRTFQELHGMVPLTMTEFSLD